MDRRNFLKFSGVMAAGAAVGTTGLPTIFPKGLLKEPSDIRLEVFAGNVVVGFVPPSLISVVDRALTIRFLKSFNATHSVDGARILGLEGGVLVDGQLQYVTHSKTEFHFAPLHVRSGDSIQFTFT